MHSGALKGGGGPIMVTPQPSAKVYRPSYRFGILSEALGGSDRDYRIDALEIDPLKLNLPDQSPPPPRLPACPRYNLYGYVDTPAPLQCSCPAGETMPRTTNRSGPVFNAESFPCREAVRVGVLPAGAGGNIRILPVSPRDAAAGEPMRENADRPSDMTRGFFRIYPMDGTPIPKTPAYEAALARLLGPGVTAPLSSVPANIPTSSPAPAPNSVSAPAAPVVCPANFRRGSGVVTCTCPPGPYSGSVWGGGDPERTYTDDSRICRAALHAGVIGIQGGKVLVTHLPGRASYAGSTANGVRTDGYGSWSGSYTVEAAN